MFVAGHGALVLVYLVAGGPVGGVVAVIATLLLLGTFYAATDGVLSALVSRLTPDATRGTGIAAAQTVVALARFAASFGFGALWFNLGTPALLIVGLALALVLPVAAWLLLPTDRDSPSPSPQPPAPRSPSPSSPSSEIPA